MANTPERNNASAATEHRKFRRGLYSARGVQSNGRHNNTWTPAVNFSWPAGDSYTAGSTAIGILFGCHPTAHRVPEARLLVHTRIYHVGNDRSPLFDPFSDSRA